MANKLAHILKGRLAGSFQNMEPDELKEAEAAGWAEPMDGRKPTAPQFGPHKAADAYFDRKADERDKARGVGKYANRMLESGEPSQQPPPKQPDTDAAPIIDPGPAPEPPETEAKPKQRGRPPKNKSSSRE